MTQRVTYGLAAIASLIAVFLADAAIAQAALGRDQAIWSLLRRGSILPVIVLVVFLHGAKEMDSMLRERGARAHSRFALVIIAAMLLSPWLSAAGFLGTNAAQLEGLYWQIVWLIVTAIGLAILAVLRREPQGIHRDTAATVLLIFCFGFLGSFVLQIRCGRDLPGQGGIWLLLFIVLITKVSDIGAYFVGTWFGRHKLAPTVSPAKSIEGAIGGAIASAGLALLTIAVAGTKVELWLTEIGGPNGLGLDTCLQFLCNPAKTSPVARMTILGLLVSFSGQLGDLFESCFKRDAGIKDSGKVFAPFGGILDLIDSLILAIPVAWFFLVSL